MVDLSVEGLSELHDVYRFDRHKKGTLDRVKRHRLLRKLEFEFNTLSGESPSCLKDLGISVSSSVPQG